MEVATLVSWSLLFEHFFALALLWAWVALAGFALLPLLRVRSHLAAVAPLGVVYWTIALYILPIKGGLDIAGALALVMAGIGAVRWWCDGAARPIWTRPSWSSAILVLGSLPYLATLLYHYVPFGMDGSMHATAATLIARSGGLPESYAPFMPDLPFPPMNLGLPALAGVAIRWGGDPAAVMLASHHLTFIVLMLATYLLLRAWINRTPAALIAVVTVWMARGTQASLGWGGFPTVLSVAIGLFAARLLWQQCRTTGWRLPIATGAAIAVIPLIHGVGGGTWLYCVGPWIALASLLQAKSKWAIMRGFALTGVTAAIVLLAYRAAGTIELQPRDLEWTHQWQQESAHLGENVWLGAIDYIRKDSGSIVVLMGWAALGVLVYRRQWAAASLLGLAWMALAIVIANSRWWFLPASFLLYPERAIYWAAPVTAIGLALVWRVVPSAWRNSKPLTAGLSAGLLVLAGYSHNQFYQKIVREDFVNADGHEALVWAREHLNPERDFVQAPYNSTGSFLPAVARIGCTGSHHHHFIAREVQSAYARHRVTHVLVDQALAPQCVMPPGVVVFRNRTITIAEVPSFSGRAATP